ncbi:hypothetical protein JI664_07840 [Rhodobacter sp. NTK016B]|uniref:hypothetical protein n=1 Tax=Rhodobacter sp. NTK016B TaxID=2759676 RepID=UPI001A8DC780|nr:hypothetical protein [Rhodobacter sp. NTK016B]MBN8291869.1 hypothetical protein [Rhodobacter sp. NTK016B]
MTRVTIQDLRTARYCLPGVRPWFRRHGFDWQEFLETGIEAERLCATGDALVEPVIAVAVTRETKALALEPAATLKPAPSLASVSATLEADDG